jgi:hypothetical protein
MRNTKFSAIFVRTEDARATAAKLLWDDQLPGFRDSLLVPTFLPFNIKRVCPETSVTKYEPMLRNIPEERRPQIHGGETWNLAYLERCFIYIPVL